MSSAHIQEEAGDEPNRQRCGGQRHEEIEDGAKHDELKITWFRFSFAATLLSMANQTIRAGRPRGSTTSDPVVAQAFGAAVRSVRTRLGVAQEALALQAKVERSHLGKIERGEHMPTLVLVLKIARALQVSSADLMVETEALLPAEYLAEESST
jgi:DNA-binding XRE family transcriptional regulator